MKTIAQITRPSVGGYDQKKEKWYVTDCKNEVRWYDSGVAADHAARQNFQLYADILENELEIATYKPEYHKVNAKNSPNEYEPHGLELTRIETINGVPIACYRER